MSNFMNRMSTPGSWDGGVMLVWLLGVVTIVVLGVVVYRLLAGPPPARPGSDGTGRDGAALRLLEGRFSAGEIDDEEFERRRATLLRSHGSS